MQIQQLAPPLGVLRGVSGSRVPRACAGNSGIMLPPLKLMAVRDGVHVSVDSGSWFTGLLLWFTFSVPYAGCGSSPSHRTFVTPRTFCTISEIALPVQWAFHRSPLAQKAPCRFPGSFVLLPRYPSPPSRQIMALHLPRRSLEKPWIVHSDSQINTCPPGKLWLFTHPEFPLQSLKIFPCFQGNFFHLAGRLQLFAHPGGPL